MIFDIAAYKKNQYHCSLNYVNAVPEMIFRDERAQFN